MRKFGLFLFALCWGCYCTSSVTRKQLNELNLVWSKILLRDLPLIGIDFGLKANDEFTCVADYNTTNGHILICKYCENGFCHRSGETIFSFEPESAGINLQKTELSGLGLSRLTCCLTDEFDIDFQCSNCKQEPNPKSYRLIESIREIVEFPVRVVSSFLFG